MRISSYNALNSLRGDRAVLSPLVLPQLTGETAKEQRSAPAVFLFAEPPAADDFCEERSVNG